jgi:aminoglycoside 2'-N-acetyltransferase I
MTPSVDIDPDRLRLRRLATTELTAGEVREIRALMDVAFGSDGEEERFSDDDWQHALGGLHFVLEVDGEIVAHAAVVERQLYVGGLPLRPGTLRPSRHRRTNRGSASVRSS